MIEGMPEGWPGSGDEQAGEQASVPRRSLDNWRAFVEQTRTDVISIRQLIARGQGEAAAQLLGSVLNQTLMVAGDMDDCGAARPAHLPPRPAPGYVYDDDD